MADALCGPSNSLQQFKQQTALDRTLQQDRLSSRPSPAQGFRSHDPNAGLLDPEFEAFQAGVPAPHLPQYQPFHQQQQPAFAGAPQAPSWASDFQRMQISPPPFHQQQHIPQVGPQSAAWAAGFSEHIAQSAPRAQQTSSPSPLAFQQRARYGHNGFQSNFAQQPSYAPTLQSKGKEPMTEQFDEAAFERAFDMAKDDMMTDENSTHKLAEWEATGSLAQEQRAAAVEKAMATMDASTLREAAGPNDMLHEEHSHAMNDMVAEQQGQEQAQHDQQGEDDALAATAQELLEKVEHNKSDKFRNSQFLSLMRKLRDREMKVEGDKMVETVSPATALSHHHLHKPTLSPHDSSYGSGVTTPRSTMSVDGYHFDTHICEADACETATAETQTLTTDASMPLFDNTEQRPSPLAAGAATRPFAAGVLDTRPPDYGIPEHEQDHDLGRVNVQDGQEVVDLLNEPDAEVEVEAEPDAVGEDIGTLPEGALFDDDDGASREAQGQNVSISDMLYGHDGTLERPVAWRSGGGS
ncbi:hypothetical protein LTR36_000965 [Oleoguttula mirabilis]|uniref:Peroxin 20 n=1 Tax=Oleoguttula mirabilis TaxID=1507867 RepID=A0AAV9JQR8_9PEZI|nr:hypothetical protein LTR36_000965 [Oleoguttula mirabilis]